MQGHYEDLQLPVRGFEGYKRYRNVGGVDHRRRGRPGGGKMLMGSSRNTSSGSTGGRDGRLVGSDRFRSCEMREGVGGVGGSGQVGAGTGAGARVGAGSGLGDSDDGEMVGGGERDELLGAVRTNVGGVALAVAGNENGRREPSLSLNDRFWSSSSLSSPSSLSSSLVSSSSLHALRGNSPRCSSSASTAFSNDTCAASSRADCDVDKYHGSEDERGEKRTSK